MNDLQFSLLQGIVGEQAVSVRWCDSPHVQYSIPRYDGKYSAFYAYNHQVFARPPAADAIINDLIEKMTLMSPIMLELLRIDVAKLEWKERATSYWVTYVPTELGMIELACGKPEDSHIWTMTRALVDRLIEKRWLEDRAARDLAPSETTFGDMEQAIVDELKPPVVPDSVGSSIKL